MTLHRRDGGRTRLLGQRLAIIDTVRQEEPDLFDQTLARQIEAMIAEAVEVEMAFVHDMLADRVPGRYGSRNPFGFMELQDVQELSNYFERTVSAYQVGVTFDEGL